MTGSPLFELLLDSGSLAGAELTIGPSAVKNAVKKLHLTDPSTGAIEHFEDTHGNLTSGRKSVTFQGKACGGTMSLSLTMELGEGLSPWKSTFRLATHFDCWEGIDVRTLPYFDKLHSLIERLRAGWQLEIELEIDGQSIGRARGALSDLGALDFIAEVLEYVSAIRAVAGYLGSCVLFRCDATLSDSAIRAACEVRDRIKRLRVFGPEVCPVKLTLTASGDNVRSILTPKVAALRVESERHELRAFGQALILPRGRIEIINFQARIAGDNVDVNAHKDGDDVPIELLPGQGFSYAESYARPDEPDETAAPD